MSPRFEYFPNTVSGRFYELRKLDLYKLEFKERVSLCISRDGRWFRELGMNSNFNSPLLGVLGSDPFTGDLNALQKFEVIDLSCRCTMLEVSAPLPGFLQISGSIENNGAGWWFGWNAIPGINDTLGVKFIDEQGMLAGESRIAFPFECIAPGSVHQFDSVISLAESGVPAGSYLVHVCALREGQRWFAEPTGGARASIEVQAYDSKKRLDITHLNTQARCAAFTFDGGSSANYCSELLDILERRNVLCTVFITGKFISRFPDLVRRLHSAGHEVCNHTLSHLRLCYDYDPRPCDGVTQQVLNHELKEAARMYRELVGAEMLPLWRAPFGDRNPTLLLWGEQAGYRHVFWSYDSCDWRIGIAPDPNFSSAQMQQQTEKHLDLHCNGQILLFHLSSSNASDPAYPAIERLIDRLEQQNYRLCKVSEAIS